jgi:hypothetical protein
MCVLAVASFLVGGLGCTTGATPDCEGGNSGCGPGFDGPPPAEAGADVASDTVSDVTSAEGSEVGGPDASVDATDAKSLPGDAEDEGDAADAAADVADAAADAADAAERRDASDASDAREAHDAPLG